MDDECSCQARVMRARFAALSERFERLRPGAEPCLDPAGADDPDAGDLPGAAPGNADEFARAAIRAICGSGVSARIARRNFERCDRAIAMGATVRIGFRHPGKADAIDAIWRTREHLFAAFAAAEDRVAFLERLPWIGGVTKLRLAGDLGIAPSGGCAPDTRDGDEAAPQERGRHSDELSGASAGCLDATAELPQGGRPSALPAQAIRSGSVHPAPRGLRVASPPSRGGLSRRIPGPGAALRSLRG